MRVRLAGISKTYGKHKALDAIDLDLAPGEIVAVLGLNGAGKSTLLHCLAGLIAPDAGHVIFDGEPFRRDRVDLRRRFGFLPDFPIFFAEMTVLEHIGMALRLYEKDGPGAEDRVLDLLRAFDLLPLAEAPLATLSRGQVYKAALVALIAAAPELWLLDEPMASGMDPLGLREFRRRARSAAEAGATIVYTTQILSIAGRFSDRAVVLHKGRLHAAGPVAELPKGGELEELFAALRETE